MRRFLFLTLAFSVLSSSAWAWGEEGHSIVAEVAQRRLSPEAAAAITAILRPHAVAPLYSTPSLASFSAWADEAARDATGAPNATYNWHFVDIPKNDDHYDPAMECPKDNPAQGDCVINELSRLRDELRCTTGDSQVNALKFAVHFVGDAHQPFHTVWDARGANDIKIPDGNIKFKGKTCEARTCSSENDNLHKVWDTTLIRAMEYNWGTFVDDLENGWLKSDAALNDTEDDPVKWVEAAHREAKDGNIWIDNNGTLDQAYYDRSKDIVIKQLGYAGLRLARYLNDVFSSTKCPYRAPGKQ